MDFKGLVNDNINKYVTELFVIKARIWDLRHKDGYDIRNEWATVNGKRFADSLVLGN